MNNITRPAENQAQYLFHISYITFYIIFILLFKL